MTRISVRWCAGCSFSVMKLGPEWNKLKLPSSRAPVVVGTTGNKTVSLPRPEFPNLVLPPSAAALRGNRTKRGKNAPHPFPPPPFRQSHSRDLKRERRWLFSSNNFDQKWHCDWDVRNQFNRRKVEQSYIVCSAIVYCESLKTSKQLKVNRHVMQLHVRF